ncbi:AhpC-TSA-domain-containing protein [Calocera cornea HHB12733]|uniref:thioredoxin-dependent peroxiredoxin n=1 Tax=Calocera cornea HHB12733 TaxID=1353952 RepID=A0A165GW02_9BASI|nr:AhpC-TSA-domain-containing protein [Calocera cornea HHB12733]
MPSQRSARNLVGRHAMPFQLPSSNGETFRFKPSVGGRPVALFFFPAAGTIGCVLQSCSIRDASNSKEIWSMASCEVIGISGNTVEENQRFVDDHRLPFTVLCDVDGVVRQMYGTGKGMFGYDARVTFFIDSHGIIREVYDSFINAIAHRKFIEKWLERTEVERQPWSKFLDYESILTDYDPGTLVGEEPGSVFAGRFSRVFSDSDGTASDDDTLYLTLGDTDFSPFPSPRT